MQGVLQFIGHILDLIGIFTFHCLAKILDLMPNILALVLRNLVSQFTEGFLGLISDRIGCIPRLDQFTSFVIFALMLAR